jgi:SnoaL-like domain
MGQFTREELQAAHDNFLEVANVCAASGEWRAWADLFTDDAEYFEHTFGRFHGPDEIYNWIQNLMSQWPNSEMTSFPHDWCVCDEERGWWICQIENRFRDPGDGQVYQEHNLTVLHYAGDNKWSYEEDAYNPSNFMPMVTSWIEAVEAHEGPR